MNEDKITKESGAFERLVVVLGQDTWSFASDSRLLALSARAAGRLEASGDLGVVEGDGGVESSMSLRGLLLRAAALEEALEEARNWMALWCGTPGGKNHQSVGQSLIAKANAALGMSAVEEQVA